MTTCFSPCIGDSSAADGQHVAKGNQDTICAQAAKFGKIAKDRERQRIEEKNNKGKKKEQTMTSFPRDINDLNAAHEAASTQAPDAAPRPAKPKGGDAIIHATSVGSPSGSKNAKGLPGGDKKIPVADSSAPAKSVAKLALSLFALGVGAIAA
ncbi:hypothetical protein GGI20_002911 [Coemansia sp. BCRC 34301]|nr:hypothetical protein GGI20_002911 [Coemansia sp. BCRC 34301]